MTKWSESARCLVPIPVLPGLGSVQVTSTSVSWMRMSMLRFIRKSVLVQRESWRVLHGLRQSSDAVEMEASSLRVLFCY